MRNLTKTLAVVSLLAPASALPLGIGDIKLHSALNQNLNAEIALVVSAGEDVSDIKVSLAPPAKFDEAGVAWSYFLSKIKFEPVVKSNGSVVIKLTSREVLKEPFLDFLVQVTWPKGNLYREFTVLVDPPAVYKQPTIPVQSSSYADEQTEQPEYIPQRRPVSRPVRRSEERITEPSDGITTQKNDTLWEVADKFSRRENVSVEQMMIAIYEENPHAFYKKNVNALMAGKRLKIPDREVALKLSRRQALAEFDRQRQAWANKVAPDNSDSQYTKDTEVDKQLTLAAPTEAEVDAGAVVTPGVDKKNSNAQAPEKSGAQTAEIQAIQSKVAELEKQLAVMQQLIALKDQQLASLQNQAAAPAAAKTVAPENPALPEASAPTPAEPIAQKPIVPQTEPQPAVTTPPPESPEPIVPPAASAPSEPPAVKTVEQQPEAAKQPDKPAEPQQAQKPAEALPPKVKPVLARPAQPKPETDYYYLTVAGLGTAALSLLGWLWWRKRKTEEETNADSMFASSSVIIVPEAEENLVQQNTAFYGVDALGESSFLSEFTTSDFDVFDTAHGEIDPISEADVYLAYGRYQQAEELIRQAIKDQPHDDECKLKLLEIFYANENKSAFETYAKELADIGKNGDTDFWAKVADMGKDICPESNLFAPATDSTMSKDHELADTEQVADVPQYSKAQFGQVDDLDLDLDIVSFAETLDKHDNSHREQEHELEVSAPDFAHDDTEDELKNNDSIEFDLSAFDLDTKKTEPSVKKVVPADDVETYAFDFDTKPAETKPAAKVVLNKAADDTIDFHDLNMESAGDKTAEHDKKSLANDFDFDFNFDFDNSLFSGEAKETEQTDSFQLTDLTDDTDELETKLDLAKAYVDMGDIGAAKDIANEILLKGSEDLKKSAQLLLDELE